MRFDIDPHIYIKIYIIYNLGYCIRHKYNTIIH